MPITYAECDQHSFGMHKKDVCEGSNCLLFDAPVEISLISRGVYSEFVGLSINAGTAQWIGVDADKRQIIEVRMYARQYLKHAPHIPSSKDHYVREEGKGDRRTVFEVRKSALSEQDMTQLLCHANPLWTAEKELLFPVTDIHHALVLVDSNNRKLFGGPGELSGAARRIRDHLQTLRDAQWPGG